jgi:Transketolase, C-terminal subunit
MFLARGWEQIRNTICKDNLNVKFVVTHSGLSDFLDGYSHQSLEDIAIFRVLPNMKVMVPADSVALKSLLNQSISFEGPCYIRIGRDNEIPVYEKDEEFLIGKAKIISDGRDGFIVACGTMLGISIEVANILRNKGLSFGVVDFHTIKPLDKDTLMAISKKTKLIFTIEEHNVLGGLGSAIAEFLSENNPIKIIRMGILDRFGTCARSYFELLQYFNLMPEQIANRIEVMFNSQ